MRDLLAAEEVWQLVAPDLPDTFPPLRSLEGHPTNLPAQPNELIGRDTELADLKRLFGRSEVRLATLFGPGGTGKTRLALQTAAELIDAFPSGAFFVNLSDLFDPDQLLAEVARVLGVRESGGQTVEDALIAYLAGNTLLLILDNLEQFRPVSRAGRIIAHLLGSCPGLRVLATSRSALRIQAEYAYALEPLAVPDIRNLPPLDELERVPSVDLFLQRARAVRPGFALNRDNARPVAEICARVDGLPLAVELAAARTRALAPAELARRLGERMDLLAGKGGDRPDRQQTLRATIDWSHDLLAPAEQMLFRRLAVFSGWFGLDEAEAISADLAPLDLDLLDGISDLLDQSLLRGDENQGDMRYRMLVMLREYGREKLRDSGDDVPVRAAHAAHFEALARGMAKDLAGPRAWELMDRLDEAHGDLNDAMEWSIANGRGGSAVKMAGILWGYWEFRGHLTEGRLWLTRVLASDHDRASSAHGNALEASAALALAQGDSREALEFIEQAWETYRAIGEKTGEVSSLANMAIILHHRGEVDRAVQAMEEANDLFANLGDRHGVAITLNSLGLLYYEQGDLPAARAKLEESLAIKRELRNRIGEAVTLSNLGSLVTEQGDLEQASVYLEQSLAIDEELGNRAGIADDLLNLAEHNLVRERFVQAAALIADCIVLFRDLGDQGSVAQTLEAFAVAAAASNEADAAARALGSAAAIRAVAEFPLARDGARRRREVEQRLEVLLGSPTYRAASAAGRLADLDHAVADALAAAWRMTAANPDDGASR